MKANPFKSFVPFVCTFDITNQLLSKLDEFGSGPLEQALRDVEQHDPTGSSWNTMHVADVAEGAFAYVATNVVVMAVQLNERVLPSRVRDELVSEKAAAHEDSVGRKPNKKEYRQLRDEAEHELLGKAFIKRTKTMVTFYGKHVIVWTSSLKRANAVLCTLVLTLSNNCGIELQIKHSQGEENPNGSIAELSNFPQWTTEGSLSGAMRALLTDESKEVPAGGFVAGMSFAFKNVETKERITFKDVEPTTAEVWEIAKDSDVTVVKMEIHRKGQDGETDLTFSLSDKHLFSGLKFPNGSALDEEADDVSFATGAYLMARTASDLLKGIGGLTALSLDRDEEPEDSDDTGDEEDY